jgi:hypothetical protein
MVKVFMERKVWLLVLWGIQISQLGFSQGFEFTECESTFETQLDSSEYCIYNFNLDSVVNIPPYSFATRKSFRPNLIENWYQNKGTNGHSYIEHYARNRNTGRNLHYINNGKHTIIICPESNSLISVENKSGVINETRVKSSPFGLAVSEKRQEIYISGLFSRCIIVCNLNTLEVLDSIPVNGHSPRYMSIDHNSDHLYCGVRSSSSLIKVDLESRKLKSFVAVENIPGTVFQSDSALYLLQGQERILGKFNSKNLDHLESRKLNTLVKHLSVRQNLNSIALYGSSCIEINDSLANDLEFYEIHSLDSSGRYTWVINSYTNPKWALAQMHNFKQNGIECYLSNLTDGHYRLCAGLYQNQEVAVAHRSKYPELFDGAWLMTIHPHKF